VPHADWSSRAAQPPLLEAAAAVSWVSVPLLPSSASCCAGHRSPPLLFLRTQVTQSSVLSLLSWSCSSLSWSPAESAIASSSVSLRRAPHAPVAGRLTHLFPVRRTTGARSCRAPPRLLCRLVSATPPPPSSRCRLSPSHTRFSHPQVLVIRVKHVGQCRQNRAVDDHAVYLEPLHW
jgi:hypothetical protein